MRGRKKTTVCNSRWVPSSDASPDDTLVTNIQHPQPWTNTFLLFEPPSMWCSIKTAWAEEDTYLPHPSWFCLSHPCPHHRFHPGHPVSAPPSPCPPLKLSWTIILPRKLPVAKPPGTCGPPWWCSLCSTPFIHMSNRTLTTSFTWPPEQELALVLSREWRYKWMNPNTLSPKRTNRMILDKSSFMELTCKSL